MKLHERSEQLFPYTAEAPGSFTRPAFGSVTFGPGGFPNSDEDGLIPCVDHVKHTTCYAIVVKGFMGRAEACSGPAPSIIDQVGLRHFRPEPTHLSIGPNEVGPDRTFSLLFFLFFCTLHFFNFFFFLANAYSTELKYIQVGLDLELSTTLFKPGPFINRA